MNRREAFNQIKSIDQHKEDLNLLYAKMENEGFTYELINQINNKRCKIYIMQSQLESSVKDKAQYIR